MEEEKVQKLFEALERAGSLAKQISQEQTKISKFLKIKNNKKKKIA